MGLFIIGIIIISLAVIYYGIFRIHNKDKESFKGIISLMCFAIGLITAGIPFSNEIIRDEPNRAIKKIITIETTMFLESTKDVRIGDLILLEKTKEENGGYFSVIKKKFNSYKSKKIRWEGLLQIVLVENGITARLEHNYYKNKSTFIMLARNKFDEEWILYMPIEYAGILTNNL